MYPPPYYTDNNSAYTNRIIDEYGFPLLSCNGESGPLATHLPMMREGEYLYGHIAANNPMAQALDTDAIFLAAFHGPHDYISAALYDKAEASVPTWDYVAVHVHGTTRLLDAEQSVARMAELVDHYEHDDGWSMEQAASYASRLFPHIHYFEMRMDSVHGLRKLSQNKNAATKDRIIKNLQDRGNAALAQEISLIRKTHDQ